jgi:hypothetical protein
MRLLWEKTRTAVLWFQYYAHAYPTTQHNNQQIEQNGSKRSSRDNNFLGQNAVSIIDF